MFQGVIKIDDFPPVMFRIGNGQTKNDRTWLKKKKEYFEKIWSKNGAKFSKKSKTAAATHSQIRLNKTESLFFYTKRPRKIAAGHSTKTTLSKSVYS